MKKIGLTGGIGSGKSSVAGWLRQKGLHVFDADQAVHELYASEKICRNIAEVFGAEYWVKGRLDRRRLGDVVFEDGEKLARLEKILYPALKEKMAQAVAGQEKEGARGMILDIPLLFEKGWDKYVEEIWVVFALPEQQAQRAAERSGLSPRQIAARMAAQIPLSEKAQRAHRIIDNQGTWQETTRQLEEIWRELFAASS